MLSTFYDIQTFIKINFGSNLKKNDNILYMVGKKIMYFLHVVFEVHMEKYWQLWLIIFFVIIVTNQ